MVQYFSLHFWLLWPIVPTFMAFGSPAALASGPSGTFAAICHSRLPLAEIRKIGDYLLLARKKDTCFPRGPNTLSQSLKTFRNGTLFPGARSTMVRNNKESGLGHSLVCLFVFLPLLSHLLNLRCLLCSCAPLRSFIRSLVHSLPWETE